jgi:hypothetical protein
MTNLNGNQFELSIPPINTLKFVGHSHSSVGKFDDDKLPLAQVGPTLEPGKVIKHTFANPDAIKTNNKGWVQHIPAVKSVQTPLFVMPHELAYHSHLGDLGTHDSELDSHGVPVRDHTGDGDTNEDLISRKLYAPHPHSEEVAESVRQHGIQVPVDVEVGHDGKLTLRDGHHRLAAAVQHRPNEPVPIDWTNVSHV